jgi:hypothetical protein
MQRHAVGGPFDPEEPLRVMAAAMIDSFGDGAVSVALRQAEAARTVDDRVFDIWQLIARAIKEHLSHDGRAA